MASIHKKQRWPIIAGFLEFISLASFTASMLSGAAKVVPVPLVNYIAQTFSQFFYLLGYSTWRMALRLNPSLQDTPRGYEAATLMQENRREAHSNYVRSASFGLLFAAALVTTLALNPVGWVLGGLLIGMGVFYTISNFLWVRGAKREYEAAAAKASHHHCSKYITQERASKHYHGFVRSSSIASTLMFIGLAVTMAVPGVNALAIMITAAVVSAPFVLHACYKLMAFAGNQLHAVFASKAPKRQQVNCEHHVHNHSNHNAAQQHQRSQRTQQDHNNQPHQEAANDIAPVDGVVVRVESRTVERPVGFSRQLHAQQQKDKGLSRSGYIRLDSFDAEDSSPSAPSVGELSPPPYDDTEEGASRYAANRYS